MKKELIESARLIVSLLMDGETNNDTIKSLEHLTVILDFAFNEVETPQEPVAYRCRNTGNKFWSLSTSLKDITGFPEIDPLYLAIKAAK